ncbi:MAG: DUF1573 domain-containing protein, partial [Bacteroidales bacterium]
QVPEAGGLVTYAFEFANTGKTPIIITDVKSSCGCTTPEWTKQPVLPGKTGSIKAIFDPKDRPGIFDKEITVATKTEQIKLKISGEVLPKAKSIANLYPRIMGVLRLKSHNLPLANIYNTATATASLPIVNTGVSPLTLSFDNVPAHITLTVKPQILQANEEGVIECSYDANKKNDWGYISDKVQVLLNGSRVKNNEITISATIEENFSTLKEDQLVNAPIAQITQTSIELGNLKSVESKEFEFEVSNTGKTDLQIRKVTSNCNCITPAVDNPKVVKVGQTVKFKASFLGDKLKGKVFKNVSLITNAPKQSKLTIRVIANVE